MENVVLIWPQIQLVEVIHAGVVTAQGVPEWLGSQHMHMHTQHNAGVLNLVL